MKYLGRLYYCQVMNPAASGKISYNEARVIAKWFLPGEGQREGGVLPWSKADGQQEPKAIKLQLISISLSIERIAKSALHELLAIVDPSLQNLSKFGK
ncbi:unnamed protein product [Linum trigynum]|uniref:Uncharacterized protein n=1 Tax=Linum trigynum TaxID=586398 RepID=A0AAV2EQR6_9ROSI